MLEKTLAFLKQQTGEEFKYKNGAIKCGGTTVYDVKNKTGFIKICRKTGREVLSLITWDFYETDYLTPMEPSEFIDKIAKGEWV